MRAGEFTNFKFEVRPFKAWSGLGIMVIAYDGEEVIGQATFEPTDRDKKLWYSTNTEVEEPYQRRGIATKMYDLAKQKAATRGAKIVPSHSRTGDAIGFWGDKTVWEDSTPQILYHATYRPLLKSIKQHGLGGDKAQAKWEDSKPGVVYLATDPDVAESYAESNDVVPEEWLDKIVVLKIDASKLDQSKLTTDQNVLDNGGDTLEYHGVIPVNLIS